MQRYVWPFMTEEPFERMFSFLFGFVLFGVPIFLLMGLVAGRVGSNFDSIFTWLVILLPTFCSGCLGGYKSATNKIYKYQSRNLDLSDAITKVHSRGQSVDIKAVAKTLGEVGPVQNTSKGYVYARSPQ